MSEIFVIDGVVGQGYDLGDLTISESSTPRVARKEILGAPARHEKVGEGDFKLSLGFKIAPREFGGLSTLTHLHQAAQACTPVFVLRGATPMGWYIVQSINSGHRHIDAGGIGRLVDASIELERTDGPAATGTVQAVAQRLGTILRDILGGLS